MDRCDALDVIQVLPRSVQRRIVITLVLAAAVGRLVVPNARVPERITGWLVAATTERAEDVAERFLTALVPPTPPAADR